MDFRIFPGFCVLCFLLVAAHSQCVNRNINPTPIYECPNDYYEHKSVPRICYKANLRESDIFQAEKHCSSEGGSLVTVSDSFVNLALYEIMWTLYRIRFEQTPLPFWIGLNDRRSEGMYHWSRCEDGSLKRGDFVNWLKNETTGTNLHPVDTLHERNCVTWVYSNQPGWANVNCTQRNYYICQLHLSPLPMTSSSSDGLTSASVNSLSSAPLSLGYVVLIAMAAFFFVLITALCLTYYLCKRQTQQKRLHLLRRTGIHPSIGEDHHANRRNAFEIPIPRQAFG